MKYACVLYYASDGRVLLFSTKYSVHDMTYLATQLNQSGDVGICEFI